MKIAVVVPRYGADVLGGAEVQARGFAEEAARRGWIVEVWTTCARSHYTWRNEWPAGREEHQGVLIRRFPVTRWDADRHAELEVRLAHRGLLPVEDQYGWLESGAHSDPLYAHVARHADAFDAVIALPYAMPLAHYAAWAAPEQTVVWPCLHDEPYAYMEPVRLLLESVWGVIFNSPEEGELAVERLGIRPRRHAILGGGVALDLRDGARSPQVQRESLLYVGRLEEGKNLSTLYCWVQRHSDAGGALCLLVIGGGPSTPPDHPSFECRGFVPEDEKALAYASALALCQPSLNESFSLTMMESWLAGRPVLVHGQCAVTRGHVSRSKGGLWFSSYEEFVGAVEWLQAHPALAARMGENGRRYVLHNYAWRGVVERFERIVRDWKRGDG